jgi:FkbM family methyltransferase
MVPFRLRFAAKRLFSLSYHRKLRCTVGNPLHFYSALLRTLPPGHRSKPVKLTLKNGYSIPIPDFWTLFVFDEIHIEHCYEPPEIMRRGPFDGIIDVGANVGIFTLRAKQLWPKAKIISIEPEPANFSRLSDLVAQNSLSDAHTLQIGVGAECGCAELHLGGRNIAGHSMYKTAGSTETISIPIKTIGGILEEHNMEGRVMMKIDCEGCEHLLIQSLTPDVAKRISCIVIEPERGIGFSMDEMFSKFRDLGFNVEDDGHLVTAVR